MGWLWGSSSESSKDDPYKKLDPKLREFLDRESPPKYEPADPKNNSSAPKSPDAASGQYRSQTGLTSPSAPAANTAATTKVPQESLYPDGRYANLWKDYKSLEEVEGSKSDQDRLADVIDSFNERKAMIGRAAVENCVFEQIAQKDCFDRGGWNARMTMCRTEAKAFNRCYAMQSRFLKALGYLSMDRTPEEDEKIQMHADKLYQEMLHRETIAEEAKAAGKPVPVYKPLLNAQSAAEALGIKSPGPQQSGLDVFPADKRKQIEASLAGKTPEERDLEVQLLVAESQSSAEYVKKVGDYLEEDSAKRADRRQRGRETFGDTIKRLWGWS